MLDQYLISHCSPTLASLKTANLFRISFSAETELYAQLRSWNTLLGDKGISLTVLRKNPDSALIYVYREARLQADLQNPESAKLLHSLGYLHTDADYAIGMLKERLAESDRFPHEIGLFLGYPPKDVIAFIRNEGRNSKCTGCWKVYYDEKEAKQTFAKFKKCRDVYLRLWTQGRTVSQLTVAV